MTPAPANVGQTQAPVIPGVFPMSAAAFLGIDMPTVGVGDAVFPVLTTNATVRTPAENADAAETTGAFSADVLTPSRLQAAFFYSREDRARFAGMDMALRENLSMALADGLDDQILSGTTGLLTGTILANNNVTAETTFALYKSQMLYGRVDGTYASGAGDIRLVVGAATYAHAAGQYRATENNYSALDVLMQAAGRCARECARSGRGVDPAECHRSTWHEAGTMCLRSGRELLSFLTIFLSPQTGKSRSRPSCSTLPSCSGRAGSTSNRPSTPSRVGPGHCPRPCGTPEPLGFPWPWIIRGPQPKVLAGKSGFSPRRSGTRRGCGRLPRTRATADEGRWFRGL